MKRNVFVPMIVGIAIILFIATGKSPRRISPVPSPTTTPSARPSATPTASPSATPTLYCHPVKDKTNRTVIVCQ